jgi:hypothetical protein
MKECRIIALSYTGIRGWLQSELRACCRSVERAARHPAQRQRERKNAISRLKAAPKGLHFGKTHIKSSNKIMHLSGR